MTAEGVGEGEGEREGGGREREGRRGRGKGEGVSYMVPLERLKSQSRPSLHLLSDRIHAVVDLEPFLWLPVVLAELLGDVWADVAESLFDGLCSL